MKKTRFSLQDNFPDDDSIAAAINRKLIENRAFSVNLNPNIIIIFFMGDSFHEFSISLDNLKLVKEVRKQNMLDAYVIGDSFHEVLR
jgi:hypothetical protein